MLFNDNWLFKKKNDETYKRVDLPHDAMLSEGRDINNPGSVNISFFGGGDYEYKKEFELHLKEGEKVFFEFEGVYKDPRVFINNKEACYRNYGYTDFIFDATDFVVDGVNEIVVQVTNSDQPNSRWYTGSGIYRPVHIFILPQCHILPRSLKITTLDYNNRKIKLEAFISETTDCSLEILDKDNNIIYSENKLNTNNPVFEFELKDAQLWSTSNPYLYKAVLKAKDDIQEETFGIRQIELNKEKGLLINGERVILYGACIHHDNGLLGAVCNKDSEERRAKILKEAGYNAIRSAHNPISRYFIDACDKLGLLILDEYADCWYIHKTMYDYACHAMTNYKEDLKDMVDKDYNHPSIIMYSTGNEVAETSQKKGIEFVKTMTNYLHSLDTTRPVTCGINIFFNALFSLGFGVYSDKKAEKDAKKKPTQKKKSVGSEFFNNLAGLMGADFMKTGAKLHLCDRKTKGSFANMDVAGYNYGIKRYKHDLKKYKDRFIVGSETFCSDAGKFYDLAQNNPRLIGDFVWAGWDYLGEAGVGSWVACEDSSIYDDKSGWLLAGSGRIDILGHLNAEAEYTKTAFRHKTISLAVVSPKDYNLGHSPSSWKLSWALTSYDFPGYENEETICEVFSQANMIKLYQNDKLIATKKKKNNPKGLYSIKLKYIPGTLKAEAYDDNEKLIDTAILSTLDKDVYFNAFPEKSEIYQDEISYINLYFTDKEGNIKPLENNDIEVVDIKNGQLLGLGNACPYYKGSYLDKKTKSYYGKALAIVKPDNIGQTIVTFKTKFGEVICTLNVKEEREIKDFHI